MSNYDIQSKISQIQSEISQVRCEIYKIQSELNYIGNACTSSISTLNMTSNKINTTFANNSNELKYFKYIKGKINNEKNILECINEEKIIKNLKILDIHNGYVGTAYLDNGEKVKIAYSNYNTGSYFIIGSPIIFTTY